MSDSTIQVTKMDAVHRQLNAAVRMWFNDDDPVAIHTLIAAAHEVLHTLFKRAGLSGLLFDSPFLKEEHRSDVARALKAPATFFKHAQRDPDDTITFHPGFNLLLLVFCGLGLLRMNEPSSVEMATLFWWLYINDPDMFELEPTTNYIPPDLIKEARAVNKRDFLEFSRQLAKDGLLPWYEGGP